jgi:PAS domain S-box-containing protein
MVIVKSEIPNAKIEMANLFDSWQRAEDAERRLRRALISGQICSWEWNIETGEIWRSENHDTLFGVSPNLEVWNRDVFLSFVHPEDRGRVERELNIIATKPEYYQFEFRVVWADGQERWIYSKYRLLSEEGAKDCFIYGVSFDITDMKRAERELEIQKLDLKRAKESSELASAAKMDFLANISHEIRTPMNAILGFTDLILDNSLSDQERHEFASRIKVNGDRLLHLIDDILDLSKFEAGKIPIEKIQFSVSELILEVLDNLEALWERKGLRLELQISSPIPMVITSDPLRLRQVLINLIGNAIKFTEQGSVLVKLRFRKGDSDRSYLVVEVVDTGIGISDEKKKALFRAFGQADNTISQRFGGTGLGLILSKRFSEALGGDLILLRSEPGAGSSFEMTIETGDVSQMTFIDSIQKGIRPPRVCDQKKEPLLRGRRVLLAEDCPDNEILVRRFLESEGAQVDVARDGLEAVEMASRSNYDIILMDVQMPRLDGLEATKRLRTGGYVRPIVALTAHALKEEAARSLLAGCNGHLTKPINRPDLVMAIQRTISLEGSTARDDYLH